ncbi:AMP-binding protein [Pseudorhodoferax sp.]|uniref:AMP-binding protein n=1 Tax=Pseudorhodoferax sp. TaxID=1993553 RepID=UPI002DD69DE7|nr:AMP-binding protein [Pseudorhodoferax sp.]
MTQAPLIFGADLDAPIAWRGGAPIARRRYLADVQALAARLPAEGAMLNLSGDRYRFAVGLGAAMLRGQPNLMPPNHQRDTVARLHSLFPQAYALVDAEGGEVALPQLRYADAAAPADGPAPVLPRAQLAAHVLTSGSTGQPVPHPKLWGPLVDCTVAGAQRLAEHLGRPDLQGLGLVATVPPQHMYGFESTVLLALLGGAAFDAERPFYPADIAAALARLPRPRMLVTTPFHLRTLLEAGIALPVVDLVLSATAPLSPQLAARAEAALQGQLVEIYGCTEAGQVATRRTTDGPEWRTYPGLALSGDGELSQVLGGHVVVPTPLADILEVLEPSRFRLLGRSNDLINIAGKRNSLAHLNFHLNSTPGVADGAFWLPDDAADGAVARLVAFVVAPGLPQDALREAVLASLRPRVDPVFLPRRIVAVPALPREPSTGKLPAIAFGAWAQRQLAG